LLLVGGEVVGGVRLERDHGGVGRAVQRQLFFPMGKNNCR
jgi:hypothetical protein